MERIGFAKDTHRLVTGRRLVLGGILIPSDKGLSGHSDADVILHALAEAIFGALALGDLGHHFPDTDAKYKDADSQLFVKEAVRLMKKAGFVLGNADISLVLEKPRVSPYIDAMRANIAKMLETDIANVSVKAGTAEGLGAIGRGEGAEASAIVLLRRE